MIYKRTCSHSHTLQDTKELDHKKLQGLAGQSVKKSQGWLKMVEGPRKVYDLTGDVRFIFSAPLDTNNNLLGLR
jgi:hypothetical protein